MCFWFRHKPELNTELDPRSGAKEITLPIPGGFADPATASATYTTSYPTPLTTQQPSPTPQPVAVATEPVQTTNDKPDHSSLLRRLTSTSHKSSATPAQSPPSSPLPLQQLKSRPQSGASTQLSTNSAQSYRNSAQPSPRWTKVSISGQIQPQSLDPHKRHNSQSGMSQRSRNASPDYIPVHAAYIPSDQLSMGTKLSPGLSSSTSTTPTVVPTSSERDSIGTMPRNTTHSYSNAVSPVEGRLPFGKESGDSHSPKNLPMGFTMQTSQHKSPTNGIEKSTHPAPAISTPPQTPPWERRARLKIVTVPVINGQAVQHASQHETEKEKSDRHILSLHLPSLKSRKKKKWPVVLTAAERERSPTSAASVEQWPGTL